MMKISGYSFEGPFDIETTNIPSDRATVYVIICKTPDGTNRVMDVGESGEVGVRIASHDRRPCWERSCNGSLRLKVYLRYMSSPDYTPEERRALEQKIRDQYRPPCGET